MLAETVVVCDKRCCINLSDIAECWRQFYSPHSRGFYGGQTNGRMCHARSVYEARKSSHKAVNLYGHRHIDCGRCLKGEIKWWWRRTASSRNGGPAYHLRKLWNVKIALLGAKLYFVLIPNKVQFWPKLLVTNGSLKLCKWKLAAALWCTL